MSADGGWSCPLGDQPAPLVAGIAICTVDQLAEADDRVRRNMVLGNGPDRRRVAS